MRSVTPGLVLWISWIATAGVAGAQPPATPAKALLRIDQLPAEPLDVVVYDPRALSLDRPLAVVRGVGPAGAEIPAGALLVALRSGRKAPDLHPLTVQPGGSARLEYRSREGWSLVVRSWSGRTRQPVAGAVVALRTAQEGTPVQPAGEERTGADGLALFSGIAALRVDAGVRHDDYLPQELPGLAGASGALAFRDAALAQGGRVRVVVRLEDQPLPGALCRMTEVRDPAASAPLEGPPTLAYEGRSDPAGVCRTGRVPAGIYRFSVLPGNGRASLKRQVAVREGEESREGFALSEIRVRGTVTLGGHPAAGLTVSVVEHPEETDAVAEVARAATDGDGAYELTLSQPGSYTFRLLFAAQSTAALERDVAVPGGETDVDFALQRALQGRILDEQKRPVAGAWVRLRWNDSPERAQETDGQGAFTFLLDSEGSGTVVVGKDGYQDSDPQEYEVEEGSQLPPLVLILHAEPPG